MELLLLFKDLATVLQHLILLPQPQFHTTLMEELFHSHMSQTQLVKLKPSLISLPIQMEPTPLMSEPQLQMDMNHTPSAAHHTLTQVVKYTHTLMKQLQVVVLNHSLITKLLLLKVELSLKFQKPQSEVALSQSLQNLQLLMMEQLLLMYLKPLAMEELKP